jgi:hypothetical protein
MWETCAVELRIRLPEPLAAEVEEVQRQDPDMLSRMLAYAMARRTIFDQLATAHWGGVAYPEPVRVDGSIAGGVR